VHVNYKDNDNLKSIIFVNWHVYIYDNVRVIYLNQIIEKGNVVYTLSRKISIGWIAGTHFSVLFDFSLVVYNSQNIFNESMAYWIYLQRTLQSVDISTLQFESAICVQMMIISLQYVSILSPNGCL